MSSPEQALLSLVSQLAFSFDGAILGVALACAAVRSFLRFTSNSKSFGRVHRAPAHTISDLRSVLEIQTKAQAPDQIEQLVFLSGQVEPKSAVDGNFKSMRPSVLVASESGEKAVIIQRTQTCVYNEWKGFFGWTYDLQAIFRKSLREQESTSLRMVPFVLVDGDGSNYVTVNMDGLCHPLPLTTVYHQLQPIDASPYTFFQALFGHEYPVGLLDEEKILSPGTGVSVIGICCMKNGIPEIKSCKDIPYFLSDMTKEQMLLNLAFKTRILWWSSVALGSLSVAILSFAIARFWNRWKAWQRERRTPPRRRNSSAHQTVGHSDVEEDDAGDVPDGQLCIICLSKRKQAAFIPCGHFVCCRFCATTVEHNLSPTCPLCRQEIHSSIRIFS